VKLQLHSAPTKLCIVGLALAAVSCGRVGLDQAVDGGSGPAGVDAAHDAPATEAGTDRPEAAPPFAITIRLTNVGAADVHIFLRPSGCFGDLLIQGASPFDQPTSIQEQDYSCDCTDCTKTNGRARCQSTDFICDEPPVVLAPGAHLDYGWDGIAQVWLPAPPAGSECLGRCSVFVRAAPGDDTFTFQQSDRAYSVRSPLPPPGGVIEIPLGGS
jgi:hypothetical protein